MSYLKNVVNLNPKSDAYKGSDHTRSSLYRLHLRKLYLQVMGAKKLGSYRRTYFEKTGKDSHSCHKTPITPLFKLLNPLKWLELSLGFLSLTVAAFAALFPKSIAYLINAILGAPFAIARGAVGMFSSPKHTWGNSLGKSRTEHPIGFSVTIACTLVVVAFVIATIVTGGAFFGVPLIAAAISAPLFAGLTAASSVMIGAFGMTGLAASIGMGFIAAGMILRMGMSALIILDKLHTNAKFDEGSVAKDLQDAGKAVFKAVKGSRGDSVGKSAVFHLDKMDSNSNKNPDSAHLPAESFYRGGNSAVKGSRSDSVRQISWDEMSKDSTGDDTDLDPAKHDDRGNNSPTVGGFFVGGGDPDSKRDEDPPAPL